MIHLALTIAAFLFLAVIGYWVLLFLWMCFWLVLGCMASVAD